MKIKFLIIKKILSLLGLFLVLGFLTNTTGIMGCGGGGDSGDETEMVDADADGFEMYASVDSDWSYDTENDYADGIDCDDDDATIYPGATETAGDGTDQDCDGYDVDADIECTGSTLDCDGDYVVDSCDNNPYDSTDATILTGEEGCDVETVDGEYYVGDGYMDISCNTYESSYGYTVSSDGMYDSTGTYVGPRTLCDNCETVANSDQADSDGNGVGDACPGDSDDCDVDTDEDNACDTDVDGNGTVDDNCVCPDGTSDCSTYYNSDQTDSDSDGSGDACDSFTDADGDGYSTEGDGSGGDIDCDDTDATVYPDSTEAEDLMGDGVDQDCDGSDLPDESEILWVYTEFSSDDDTDYDGSSPDQPIDSIDRALDAMGSGITYIFVYEGEGNDDDIGLNIDEEVTIIGGFKCYTTDGNGEEVELDINDADERAQCTDVSQVRRTVAQDLTELDIYNLTRLPVNDEGHTVTISENATVEGFYIPASTDPTGDEDGIKAAVYIDNKSPTLQNNFIYAPIKEETDDELAEELTSIAVYIDESNQSTSVTLTSNYIVAGTDGDEDEDDVPDTINVYGIYGYNAPIEVSKNRISIINTNATGYGFYVETEDDVEIYNNIIEAQYGIYFYNTDDTEVINNTFYVYTEGAGAALFFEDSTDADIINNIFDSPDTGLTYAIYTDSTSKLSAELRNNLFSPSLYGYILYPDSYGGGSTHSTSNSQLQGALATGSTVSNNLADDDDDLDLDSDTYTPNDEDSLAVDAGYSTVDVGDTDHDGDERIVDTIDIGAQEYQSD